MESAVVTFEDVIAWDAGLVWDASWQASGRSSDVVESLRDLWSSRDDDAAAAAYWGIDNVVVVQGTVYPAAGVVVEVLQRMIVHGTDLVRRWALELVLQVLDGWALPGSDGAAEAILRSRTAVLRSLDAVYSLLVSREAEVRALAVEIVSRVEPDPALLQARLTWAANREQNEAVRSTIAQHLGSS